MPDSTSYSPPLPALQGFVSKLWASTETGAASGAREHVLPTGQMHLVFRLSGPPLQVLDRASGMRGATLRGPVVGGPRSTFYAKDHQGPTVTVGAMLLPGAAHALFGVSAEELSERHTLLADLWGAVAGLIQEQLQCAPTSQERLALLAHILAVRLENPRPLHPAVGQALAALRGTPRIAQIVRSSQYSHRGFVALFRQATGLGPKRYAGLLRFQRLLRAMRSNPEASMATLALDGGFSDQSHMQREFRRFAGLTPQSYRDLAPDASHHVVISPEKSDLFNTGRAEKTTVGGLYFKLPNRIAT